MKRPKFLIYFELLTLLRVICVSLSRPPPSIPLFLCRRTVENTRGEESTFLDVWQTKYDCQYTVNGLEL